MSPVTLGRTTCTTFFDKWLLSMRSIVGHADLADWQTCYRHASGRHAMPVSFACFVEVVDGSLEKMVPSPVAISRGYLSELQ